MSAHETFDRFVDRAHSFGLGLIGLGALVGGVLIGSGETATVGGIAVGGWAFVRLRERTRRRRWGQLAEALDAGDPELAQRLLTSIRAALEPRLSAAPFMQLVEATILMQHDRWAEAQQLFDRFPDSASLAGFRATRVRCLAELDPQRAITLGDQLLAGDEKYARTLQRALAVAHLRAGDPERALRLLDQEPAPASARAAERLCRGEALRALGREPEAQAAFAEVVQLAPKSAMARKARAHASQPPPTAYR